MFQLKAVDIFLFKPRLFSIKFLNNKGD